MTFHKISDYLAAKERWQNAPAQIRPDGTMRVFVKGAWVDYAEFAANNSKPVFEPLSPENPDGKHIPKGVVATKGSKAAKVAKPSTQC